MHSQSATSPRTEFATPSAFFRAPTLPNGFRCVLWTAFAADTKPYGFASAERLARHIHRARAGYGITLTEEPVSFRDGRRTLIRVDAHDASGERHRLIGHAWMGARTSRDTLTAALRDHEPVAPAPSAARDAA